MRGVHLYLKGANPRQNANQSCIKRILRSDDRATYNAREVQHAEKHN
jgi:hypothetical protein